MNQRIKPGVSRQVEEFQDQVKMGRERTPDQIWK